MNRKLVKPSRTYRGELAVALAVGDGALARDDYLYAVMTALVVVWLLFAFTVVQ